VALPSNTQTYNNLLTSTYEYRKDDLVDNVFGSAPLLIFLRKRNQVGIRGGTEIQVNHIYAGFAGSSYGPGTPFSTDVSEFMTKMRFPWKHTYIPVNLDVIEVEKNDGPYQVVDMMDAALANAELSLIDEISTQIFSDGTGNAGLDMDGLANGVSRTGTYGGITRGSDTVGASVRAALENTTGGVLSLGGANEFYQTCVVSKAAPDLLVTTQTLYNRFWERSQPSERNKAGDNRDIGMASVTFNNADVIVDSHCPSGFMYFLNTEYWEFYMFRGWDFVFRGFLEPTNQQRMIGQLILWSNLCCRAPRLQGVASSLT
jgi:hypothetical protein